MNRMGIIIGPAAEGCCEDFMAHSKSYDYTAAAVIEVNVTLSSTLSPPLYAGLGPFPDWVHIRSPKLLSDRHVV